MATATKTRHAAATITVARADLANALRAIASIKAKHVHLNLNGEASIAGYTPDVAVHVQLDGDQADGTDSIAVDRVRFAAALPYCASEVKLTTGEHRLSLTSGESTFELARVREDNAPTHGHVPAADVGDLAATFEAPTLVEILRRTLPFAGKDWTRPVLCNVALWPKDNCAAATDSYRLAIVRYGDGADKPTDVPIAIGVDAAVSIGRLLKKKLGPVEIRQGDDHVGITFEALSWTTRRYVTHNDPDLAKRGGRFPSVFDLLPTEGFETTMKVDREDLLEACRASVAMSRLSEPMKLHVGKKGARIELDSRDVGSVKRRLPTAEIEGGSQTIEMGVNPAFVADMCSQAPVERITARFTTPLRPVLFEAARDRYLVMPIRIVL